MGGDNPTDVRKIYVFVHLLQNAYLCVHRDLGDTYLAYGCTARSGQNCHRILPLVSEQRKGNIINKLSKVYTSIILQVKYMITMMLWAPLWLLCLNLL